MSDDAPANRTETVPSEAGTTAQPASIEPPSASPVGRGAESQQHKEGWKPPKKNWLTIIVIIVAVIAALVIILYAWRLWPFGSAVETTEDAYIDGGTTTISSQVSGYVVDLPLQDYQFVHKGQIIARIDSSSYRQKVDQAKAQLNFQIAQLQNSYQTERQNYASLHQQDAQIFNARGQLNKNQADMDRVATLAREGSLSIKDRDQSLANLRQSQAQLRQTDAQRIAALEQIRSTQVQRNGLRANVEQAKAQIEQAKIDLDHTIIHAPQDGRLAQFGVRLGQFVNSGSQLTFLVPRFVWVSANYKEKQTSRMAPNQPAWIEVDALGGARINGRTQTIAPATGSQFQVIKPENATGNFVKVPQRLTVRILLDRNDPLYPRLSPGMSVVARIDTTDGPDPKRDRRR